MEQFEEKLHQDLHQFLLPMKEVDERLPECPDVEGKWEEIAKASNLQGFVLNKQFSASDNQSQNTMSEDKSVILLA